MLGHNERLERKLKEQGGKRAWATVLESKKEWTGSGGWNVAVGQAGSFTTHAKLRLRVEPDGEPPFETTVKQVFNDASGWRVPGEGYSVPVVYDPHDHSKLALDLEGIAVGPGVDRDEAVARHEKVMARMHDHQAQRQEIAQMRDPEARREAIAKMQAAALAQAQSAAAMQRMKQVFPQAYGGTPDVADQLTKLADLRDRGVLTDDEFEAQKAKLLGAG